MIGISGGIDSAVAISLACNAIGKENVLGVILPEKESNPESQKLAKMLCEKLKIKYDKNAISRRYIVNYQC